MTAPRLSSGPILQGFTVLIVLPAIYQSRSLPRLRPRTSQDDTCPVLLSPQPPSVRIVGGDPSSLELASSIAYITRGNLYSTGVLISPNIVAFSAHESVDTDWKVYIGLQNVSNGDALATINIKSVTRYPSFSESSKRSFYNYNLAFLTLTDPAPSSASPVKVNDNLNFPQNDSIVRLVGYGSTVADVVVNPDGILYQVDVPLYNFSRCLNLFDYASDLLPEHLFCAGYLSGGCSTCNRDAPVIQYNSANEPVLVAMLSGISSCGDFAKPNFYVRTAPLASFFPGEVQRTSEVEQALFEDDDVANDTDTGDNIDESGTEDTTNGSKAFPVGAVVGAAVGGVLLIVIIVTVCACRKIRNDKTKPPKNILSDGSDPFSPAPSEEKTDEATAEMQPHISSSDPKPLPLPEIFTQGHLEKLDGNAHNQYHFDGSNPSFFQTPQVFHASQQDTNNSTPTYQTASYMAPYTKPYPAPHVAPHLTPHPDSHDGFDANVQFHGHGHDGHVSPPSTQGYSGPALPGQVIIFGEGHGPSFPYGHHMYGHYGTSRSPTQRHVQREPQQTTLSEHIERTLTPARPSSPGHSG